MFSLAQAVATVPFAAIGGVAALLLISAFFSSSEIALFSIDDLFVSGLDAGDDRVAALRRLRKNPHRLLVTILVGNNVVNIAIASIATTILVDRLPAGYAVTASTVLVSVLVLVVGEISPKSYGVANAESWSLRVARPLELVQTAMFPLVAGFELVTRGVVRLTGGSTAYQPAAVTRAEVNAFVESAERAGVVHPGERELIQRTLEFSGTPARDVMTPRDRVIAVEADATAERAIGLCATHRVTHLPVYEGSLDRIVGSVDLRDLVAELEIGGSGDGENSGGAERGSVSAPGSNAASVSAHLHPVLSIFGDRAVDGVLRDLQNERFALAVVLDGSGTVEGILTAEDIVEELVGEIPEGDDPPSITRVAGQAVIARGDAPLGEAVRLLDVSLPADVGTETSVASFLAGELGRAPVSGDVIRSAGIRLTVGAVDGDEAVRVRIEADSDGGESR
ncbi:CNNM domain-containing protein [Halobellus sp. GM3]|uniref:CNNM domain-containing protein n=1 Tax=Halobellus sp. GM3 TaxID=3458410 RepID=UPI00403DF919